MRIFETPGVFDPAANKSKEQDVTPLVDLSGGRWKDRPTKQRRKMVCHTCVLCAAGNEVHTLGLSKRGHFFALNHPSESLTADAVAVHLGALPLGCTRIFLQYRAVFDWLRFDAEGSFVYSRQDKWKAITIDDDGNQKFLHGYPSALFETTLRAMARKFRRHEAVLRKHICATVSGSALFDGVIKRKEVTPDTGSVVCIEKVQDYNGEDMDVLSKALMRIRKRYRHLAHMLKSEAEDSVHTELIYRYIP